MAAKSNTYRVLLWIIKLVIFGATVAYIYYKLTDKDNNFQWADWWADRSDTDMLMLIGILLLMPVNWGLEAYKWRYLIRVVEKVSMKTAVKATLVGSTISLLTPNRIGGFLGRILFLKPSNRMEASWVSILGNFSQLLATLVFGMVGMLLIADETFEQGALYRWLVMAGVGVAVVFYWRADWWGKLVARVRWLRSVATSATVLSEVPVSRLNGAFGLSLMRYVVFGIQFYMMLRICGVEAGWLVMVGLIGVAYLIIAIVPSFLLGNLGIRESVVLFIFAGMGAAPDVLVAGSLCLWIINIVFPAAAGAVIMMVANIKLKEVLK